MTTTVSAPVIGIVRMEWVQARFWLIIGMVTAFQVGLRGWAAAGGWFYWDDFWWHDIVADNGLRQVAGLSLGGHYSPLTYIPYYLVTAAFPYEWLPRVLVMLVTLLGVNAGVLAVARRLWLTRGPQVCVYVLWAFSSLATPSWLWYSQFSMLGALLLTSTWTLWAYLRALASHRTRDEVLAVALLAASLFTQERMLVSAALIAALLLFVCRPTMQDLMWARRGFLWSASLITMLVWLAVYRSLPSAESALGSADHNAGLWLGLVRVSAVPALVSGPWVLDDEPVLPRAGTPMWAQVCALVGVIGLILWSQRDNRLAWRSWAVLGAGIAVDAALVVGVRGATLGDQAIGEWRYFSDLAVLAAVLIVAAFIPPGTTPSATVRRNRIFAVLLTVYALSGALLIVAMGTAWRHSPAREYVQTAASDLRAAGPVELLDRWLPAEVVNEALMGQRLASNVLSILRLPAQFGGASTDPRWLDDKGHVVSGGLVQQRRSPGTGQCPYPLQGVQTRWIPLSAATDYFDWGVRIDYSSSESQILVVTDGVRSTSARAPAGMHSLFVPFPGVASQVGLHLSDPSATTCIAAVTAGRAGPG